MRAPPSFFGYQIFAALVLSSSACNLRGVMTLLLHYWLASSGVPFLEFFVSLSRLVTWWSLDYL
ncbi:uncharacterized protein BJ212DRAFT_1311281 [Suillus subaureus]|uniref:Uncharacterized protein n=1 Tax=Suillus subaureus TaxID=48587 RepID=A0A9P7JK68_9AGAM|nr:uncharacterized protein BJ212DRAFT_1311281 [Suillus subaureus]KAG1827276.1 hypothetical protein BJ212DRAFT_1311281 [Suillus subaureus]